MSNNSTLVERLKSRTTMRYDRQVEQDRPGPDWLCQQAAARIVELEAEGERLRYELMSEIRAERPEKSTETWVDRLTRGIIELEDEGMSDAARIAELEAERDRYHATNERLIADLSKARTRIAELEAEIARLTAVMADYEAEMVPSLTARIAELEAEKTRWKIDLADTTASIFDAKERIAELDAERDEAWNTGFTEGYNEAFERYGSERDRLREALKPFANAARAVDASMPDDYEMTCIFTAGELRAARKAQS